MLNKIILIALLCIAPFVQSVESEIKAETLSTVADKASNTVGNEAAGQSQDQLSSETENQLKLPPGVKKSDLNRKTTPTYVQEISIDEAKDIKSWSLQFWARWSVKDPIASSVFINHWNIAGVSEKQNPWADDYGYNNLRLYWQYKTDWLGNLYTDRQEAKLWYNTHSTALGGNVQPMRHIAYKGQDFDSTWIFYYISYDQPNSRMNFIFYSSRFGKYYDDQLANIVHYQGASRKGPLGFYVGASPNQGIYAFPGYFFDIQVVTSGGIYSSQKEVYDNVLAKIKKPPKMNPDPNYVQLIGDTEQVSKKGDTFNENSNQFKKIYKFAGAEEWAIQGWFKQDANIEFVPDGTPAYQACLYRITSSEPGYNVANDGILSTYFDHRTSYRNLMFFYGSAAGNSYGASAIITNKFDQTKYYWIYQGYDAINQKLLVYIRQGNVEYLNIIYNVMQFIPKFFGINIGREKDPNSIGFNGVIRNFYFRVGPGAFNNLGYFDDNFINMKDMNCATLYSDCMYQGNSYQVCSTQNSFDPNFPVWSIKLPFGKKLKLYNQSNLGGSSVEFTTSQQCLKSINFPQADKKLLLQEPQGVRFLNDNEINFMKDNNVAIHYHDPESYLGDVRTDSIM